MAKEARYYFYFKEVNYCSVEYPNKLGTLKKKERKGGKNGERKGGGRVGDREKKKEKADI